MTPKVIVNSLNLSKRFPNFVADQVLNAGWESLETLLDFFTVSFCGQEHLDMAFDLVGELS